MYVPLLRLYIGKLEFEYTLQQRDRAVVLSGAVVYKIFEHETYGKLAGVMVPFESKGKWYRKASGLWLKWILWQWNDSDDIQIGQVTINQCERLQPFDIWVFACI